MRRRVRTRRNTGEVRYALYFHHTMRLHILSDLHLEFARFQPPRVEADAVILAGDVHNGMLGLRWIRENFPDKPVLYIPGNHEFYKHGLPALTLELKAAAAGTNVHVLENDCAVIDGVAFLGATLWTDFALRGDAALGGLVAESEMNDFHLIRQMPENRKFRAMDARKLHAESVAWLNGEIAMRRAQKKIIITHHAPSERSVPAKFHNHPLNPAFTSKLDALVAESGAALWIHGHIHGCSDYTLGSTRVIANTRGYPGEGVGGFDPALVIEV